MGAKPSHGPWTPAESKALLMRIYKERNEKRLHDRTREDCEQHLKDILIFLLPRIYGAIDTYHKRNPQSTYSKEETTSILSQPLQNCDEEHYYDVLSETFKQDGTIKDGIYRLIDEYYAQRAVVQHVNSEEEGNQPVNSMFLL